MNQRQSWKWDAEAAFKRIEAQELDVQRFRARCTRGVLGPVEIDPSCLPRRPGWTRAADPALYARHEVDKPHGRDYEALTKAALRKPVGYWEDAPRGMEFGGGGEKARLANAPVPVSQMSHAAAPSAPTTPPPAAKKPPVGYYEDVPHGIKFGGQPLLSASTKPHGKDVDTADGPWPKCALSPSSERIGLSVVFIQAEAGGATTAYYTDGTTRTYRTPNGVLAFGAVCTDAGAIIRALEQNGHADVAAQLRGKAVNALSIPTKLIGGPERDAIVAECRKAMGI